MIKAPHATVVECFGSWTWRKQGEHAQNTIIWGVNSPAVLGLVVGLYLFLFFDHWSLTSLQNQCLEVFSEQNDPMHSRHAFQLPSTLESRMLVSISEVIGQGESTSWSHSKNKCLNFFLLVFGILWNVLARVSCFQLSVWSLNFSMPIPRASWKGANVKIGTVSLIHSILRDLDSYKPLLGRVQTLFWTRGYAWILDTWYLWFDRHHHCWVPSPLLLQGVRRICWPHASSCGWSWCDWRTSDAGKQSSPSAHLCSQIQIKLTWN